MIQALLTLLLCIIVLCIALHTLKTICVNDAKRMDDWKKRQRELNRLRYKDVMDETIKELEEL